MSDNECKTRYKRKKPRYYKPCDVVRIFRNCVDDNRDVTNEILLALIANSCGYSHIATNKVDFIESSLENEEAEKLSGLIKWLESTRNVLDRVLRGWGLDL